MKLKPEANILLVDDRPENLLALEAILESPEHRLVKAHSGEEALKCLLSGEFAVILLDVHMPGMDGFETARLIKEREKNRHTPIIFVTAISKEERFVFQGYSTGAVDYIFKPFAPEILKVKVGVFVELFNTARQLKDNYKRLQRVEEEVRKEKERLHLIIENVAEPILVTGADAQKETLLMNERMKAFLDEQSDLKARGVEAINRNNLIFGAFVAPLILDGSEMRKEELTMEDPVSHQKVPFRVTAVKIRDAQKKVFGVVSIFHNLTELRELERRRLEKEFFEMEKMAALGRLAAAMAHEINNPLEAILNSIYLIASKTSPQDQNYPFLKIAEKEIERISRMIQEMLGFYRAGRVISVEVNLVLKEVIDLVEGDLNKRGIQVVRQLGATPKVKGSADQLKQVFLNLILNARNAMDSETARGGVLTLTTRFVKKENGSFVEIEIKDTGRGIPKEALFQIFEPFYTSQRARKGSGLGLWVSQEIVNTLHGAIHVESEEGTGTTFTVAIPAQAELKEEGRDDQRYINERENLTGRR
jgi:signal transduction histidine kinase/DNA-binding NarL/FixJ family response regulator